MPAFSDSVMALAQRLTATEQAVKALMVSKPLNLSAIRNGAISEYDSSGKLVGRIGLQPDGSHTYAALDGPTPPKPGGVSVFNSNISARILEVSWDGTADGGKKPPLDTDALEVWTAFSEDGSTPQDSWWLLCGSIATAGGSDLVTAGKQGWTTYIRARLRSRAGKTGAWLDLGKYGPTPAPPTSTSTTTATAGRTLLWGQYDTYLNAGVIDSRSTYIYDDRRVVLTVTAPMPNDMFDRKLRIDFRGRVTMQATNPPQKFAVGVDIKAGKKSDGIPDLRSGQFTAVMTPLAYVDSLVDGYFSGSAIISGADIPGVTPYQTNDSTAYVFAANVWAAPPKGTTSQMTVLNSSTAHEWAISVTDLGTVPAGMTVQKSTS